MTSAPEITDFSMDWFSLKGKVAIKAGADLFIPCHSDDWQEIKALVEAEGRRAEFLQGDLRDRDYLYSIPEKCLEAYGKIDILVNNAGTNCFADFLEFPDDGFRRVVETNMMSVYYMGHEVAKVMAKQGGGKIINIGSALSYTADFKCPSYVTAKHGVIGITRCFASELGPYNIQCNAICPGFIQTEVNRAVSDDPVFYQHITDRISNGRWGTLADLMGLAVFLASPASDYLNGADIKIDGGFSTRL